MPLAGLAGRVPLVLDIYLIYNILFIFKRFAFNVNQLSKQLYGYFIFTCVSQKVNLSLGYLKKKT